MGWKVYELNLARHEAFVFYKLDGVLTSISNLEHPVKSSGHWWDATKQDYVRVRVEDCPPDKIVVPVMRVKKEDIEDYVQEQIIKGMFDKCYTQEFIERNLMILKKDWGDYFEIGSALYEAITNNPNENWQRYLDRLVNLKAFM